MHPAVLAFFRSLSTGGHTPDHSPSSSQGTVGRLAVVYEIARNAMEYRADHLVRRAAIARILRRQLLFGTPTKDIAEQLLLELQWALYLTEVEENKVSKGEIEKILEIYSEQLLKPVVPKDWLIGLISAEIEEKLNPNVDYHRFTTFAFHTFKNKIQLREEADMDLLLYVAVDMAYSQSDDEQVSYHLYKLIRSQADEQHVIEDTWRHHVLTKKNRLLLTLVAFVRRNSGPLVLLRDMYFYKPNEFVGVFSDRAAFDTLAKDTLAIQLQQLQTRIRNATIRSLLYVFLTKMLVVLLIEIPLERYFGHVQYLKIAVNVAIPVFVMWLLTASVRIPNSNQQTKLVAATWEIIQRFGTEGQPGETLLALKERPGVRSSLNYVFYLLLFALTFIGITWLLRLFGYGIINQAVFLFFLCVVAFFAYRIRQTTLVYQFRSRGRSSSSFLDILLLPTVVVGGWLSTGVSKLNFLAFAFDVVLEAPFKLVLKFLDNWFTFLSRKKDEVVG